MMLHKLVLTNFSEGDLSEPQWNRLRSCAAEVVLAAHESDEWNTALGDADGLVLRLGMAAEEPLFSAAPNLRYLSMFGTGYGRINTELAKEKGVVVTNVADYATAAVAELVIAALISQLRNLEVERERALGHDFSDPTLPSREIGGLRIGVVGAGAIGSDVAQKLRGLGATVRYWSRSRKERLEGDGIDYSDLSDLLKNSDAVSIHLSANPETNEILSDDRIEELKPNAILINTAPNELVNLDSVMRRCAAGTLVYIMDHPDELDPGVAARLADTPNAIVYPPIGYTTAEAAVKKADVLVRNLEEYASGSTPTNQVA